MHQIKWTGTPWTGRLSVTGPTHRDNHAHALIHTYGQFKNHQITWPNACVWTLGGSQSDRRETTQTRVNMQTRHRKGSEDLLAVRQQCRRHRCVSSFFIDWTAPPVAVNNRKSLIMTPVTFLTLHQNHMFTDWYQQSLCPNFCELNSGL